ncbi:MAG: type II toxin-antitoxin system VapC family toxin [Nitrospinae bacterium]|nr:type II toxin-antitoxin system VapC family toxin [Nitrospinota bacterium]
MPAYLFDTCAVIWIAEGARLREPAASELPKAREGDIFVSPMSAWEIATLASKGKIALAMSPEVWFERFRNLSGIALADMPPSVLIASAYLPGAPPADPADRILLATAREFGYTLVTRDAHLLEYGEKGHVRVMGC